MNLGLEGKVAVVTGGSKGVGRGVADALVAEGCHVCIYSRDEEEVRRAAEEIEDAGAGGARVLAAACGVPGLREGVLHQRVQLSRGGRLGSVSLGTCGG